MIASLLDEVRVIDSGPLSALSQISDLMDADNAVNDNCHPIIHRLGRAAYREFGVESAFAGILGTNNDILLRLCNGAYLHGVIETHLKEVDDPVEAALELDKNVCVPLHGVPKGMWECQHSIGHGFIQKIRNERDQQTIVDAIHICRRNKGFDIQLTMSCENGVWMNCFAASRFEGAFSFDMSSSSPSLELCVNSDIDAFVPGDCALYAATEYLLHQPKDYEGAIQWCLADDNYLQKYCVEGVGMQTAKENLRDYQILEKACLTAPKSYQPDCIKEGFMYQSFSTGESKMPQDLCNQVPHFMDDCLAFDGSTIN